MENPCWQPPDCKDPGSQEGGPPSRWGRQWQQSECAAGWCHSLREDHHWQRLAGGGTPASPKPWPLSCPSVAMQQPGRTSSSGSIHSDLDFCFCGNQARAPSQNTHVLLFIFRRRRGPKLHYLDSFITWRSRHSRIFHILFATPTISDLQDIYGFIHWHCCRRQQPPVLRPCLQGGVLQGLQCRGETPLIQCFVLHASAPGHLAPPTRRPSTNDQRRQPGNRRSGQQRSFRSQRSEATRSRWGHCNGVDHRPDNCFVLAQHLSCYKCRQPGHIMPACRSGVVGAVLRDVDDHPEVMPWLLVSFVHTNGMFSFECFPDSGSATSLISADLVSMHRLPIQPQSSRTVFISMNGVCLRIDGKVLLDVKDVNGNVHCLHLLVSPDITKEVLLGYKILCELGVVPKDFPWFPVSVIKADVVSNTRASSSLKMRLLSEFLEVLTGVLPQKPMETECMEIFLNDWVKPMHVINARPVPLHYQDKADALVWKLVDENIITKVDVPTVWCSPAFFVKKPGGGLRLVT